MSEKIALATNGGWPKQLDTKEQSLYIFEVHGLKVSPKKIANDRSQRRGPATQYLGSKPLATPAACDDYAKRLLTDRSPHSLARERRRAAGLPTPSSPGRPRKSDQDKAKEKLKPEARP